MRILFCLIFVALLVAFAAGTSVFFLSSADAGEEKDDIPTSKYVGVDGCKFCHQGKRGMHVYQSWEKTEHAKAFEHLSDTQRKNDRCLACHTTGFGHPIAAGVTPKMLHGVQCESCHGAGSGYKKMKIMKDRAIATQMGLVVPTKELCRNCHSTDLPKECWKGADTSPEFRFESAVKKITHKISK